MNYYFDETHPLKPYTFALAANPDTLPPLTATRLAPEFRAGFWPIWTGAAWSEIEDHRGQVAYDQTTGQESEVKELGPWPEGFTPIPWPGPAYRWGGEGWVYDRALDSPGADYEWREEAWWRVKFSGKDFILWCGLDKFTALNAARRAGNDICETIHDLCMRADFIDVTDPATVEMVGLLTSPQGGSILTAGEAARILKGGRVD